MGQRPGIFMQNLYRLAQIQLVTLCGRCDLWIQHPERGTAMFDLFYLMLGLGLFALAAGYVRFCERL